MTIDNKYQMFLSINGERETMRIPVLPEQIQVKKPNSVQSVNVVGLGEIIAFKDRPAVQISFSSFFPAKPILNMGITAVGDPIAYKDKMTDFECCKQPIHLIITGCNIDIYVAILDFQYYEKGGDVGTLYYTLSLKEWRVTHVRQIDVSGMDAYISQDTSRIDNTIPPQIYTVKRGDCLYNIAKALLGNPERWRDIHSLNSDIIKNPNLIYPGQILKIPA